MMIDRSGCGKSRSEPFQLGKPGTSFFPTRDIDPLSGLSKPVIHLQTASLPDPTSPTKLTISPFLTEKLNGCAPFAQIPEAPHDLPQLEYGFFAGDAHGRSAARSFPSGGADHSISREIYLVAKSNSFLTSISLKRCAIAGTKHE
jgi:hypothetical protein